MPSEPSVSIPKLVMAFGAIYFIWGSTYVAIHYAIQTLQPVKITAEGTLEEIGDPITVD